MDQDQERGVAVNAHTQAELQALRAALVSGLLRVTYDGRTVEYRSMSDLVRAIAIVESDLGLGVASRQHYPTFSKGL